MRTKLGNRRMLIVVGAQAFWIGVVCLVGLWWGTFLLRQASRIEELEVASGVARSQAQLGWHRTEHMLFWESTTFFVLAVLSSVFLFWLYWLDMRRTRSIQAFFASVTHELRTPLTSIRLQAESIAEGAEASQRELVSRLLEDTSRLESQVERTLELARLEGGGPVFVQPLRLRPWLARIARSWQDSHGTRASFDISVDELTVEADPTALQVVLKNLCENSLRHARKDKVHIRIEAAAQSGRARIVFHDDGLGFDGHRSELGKLFHRGSASQGSGVGLYLCKALMRRMGGDARFEGGAGFRTELELGLASESAPGQSESDHD